MIARHVFRLTAATALAASLTGLGVGTAATATAATGFPCSAQGYGSTLSIAEHNAELELRGDYVILSGFTLLSSSQQADGSWFALVGARCGNPR
ncbi:MAG: hypothetical protein HOV83_15960 [Catenulispora sp.]|nr:hypothetical protein [Catenulispora sp.]